MQCADQRIAGAIEHKLNMGIIHSQQRGAADAQILISVVGGRHLMQLPSRCFCAAAAKVRLAVEANSLRAAWVCFTTNERRENLVMLSRKQKDNEKPTSGGVQIPDVAVTVSSSPASDSADHVLQRDSV